MEKKLTDLEHLNRELQASLAQRDREIAERQRAEEALRETEAKFRTAFEDASIGMCLTGTDGRFLAVNGALCMMLGYSQAELLGRTFAEVTHPEDAEPSR